MSFPAVRRRVLLVGSVFLALVVIATSLLFVARAWSAACCGVMGAIPDAGFPVIGDE